MACPSKFSAHAGALKLRTVDNPALASRLDPSALDAGPSMRPWFRRLRANRWHGHSASRSGKSNDFLHGARLQAVGSLRCRNHRLHRRRVDGDHAHSDSRERKSLDENKELLHGVPPRCSGNLKWVQSTDALRRVYDSHRGEEQGEAEGEEP
jgi:hypothetical protein